MVSRLAAAIVLTTLLGSGAAVADCLKAEKSDQVAEGKLTSSRFTTEAYRLTEQAYILRLRSPACLEGSDEYDKVEKTDRIHVFSMDAAMLKRMRGLVGKNVRVTGSPFGEHTAHHHAPIVMSISTIDRR
ncbi:MAG: DUF4431 domain-containing protein [Pseudomonadota bacterium]